MLTRILVVAIPAAAAAAVAVAATALRGSTQSYEGSRVGSAALDSAAPPAPALFVSTSGSDESSCAKESPCRSFGHAYRLARPGQVVEVSGGSYPGQTIGVDPSKSSSDDVVFRPAPGTSVRVGAGTAGLDVRASHVTVVGLVLDFWSVSGSDVTMRAIDGQSFYLSGSDVLVDGGDYGPYEPSCAPGSPYPLRDNPTVSSGTGGPPRNVVIRGAVFHDMTTRNCSAAHMDCLQVAAVNGLVIEGNKFRGCFSNGLILTGDFGLMHNIVVQNNWFGPTLVRNPGLNWNPTRDCPGAIVRYNTFVSSGVRFECSQNKSAQMYANIVPTLSARDCGEWKAVQHHNVSDGGQAAIACGPGSYVAADRRVDLADRERGDYHLPPGSEAIGRGEAGGRLRSDIDGHARPHRLNADAGADQREPALLVLGRRMGMVEIGMRRSGVERFYGARRARFVRAGSRRVRIASYARPGGRLLVTYHGDRVVGTATTSAYYSTPNGLGVGAAIEATPWLARLPWSSCSKAYRRSLGPVTLEFRPAGGKGGKTIARIAMTRRRYAVC